MSAEHGRLSARLRHPSAGSALWTSIELTAPVEAVWMLELADLVSEPEEVHPEP